MRENNLYALDRLDEIPDLPGPKFVFAHLRHPPSAVRASTPTARSPVERRSDGSGDARAIGVS